MSSVGSSARADIGKRRPIKVPGEQQTPPMAAELQQGPQVISVFTPEIEPFPVKPGSLPGTAIHHGLYCGQKVMAEKFPAELAAEARAGLAGILRAQESLCVRSYGMWGDENSSLLVMDRIEHSVEDCMLEDGRSDIPIRFVLNDSSNQPTAEGIDFLKEVGLGLARMHKKRLVHGRLSPSSVLVTDTGEPRFSSMGACLELESELSEEEVARHQAEDVRAFGELCRVCWTRGQGDTAGLWPEALELVTATARQNYLQVPTMRLVNALPLWWTSKQSFNLILEIAEHLSVQKEKAILLDTVAGHAISGNWHSKLTDCPDLLSALGTAYDSTRASDLLRMLRDQSYSYIRLPHAAKLQLGGTDQQCYRFVQRQFPRLQIALHAFVLEVCTRVPMLALFKPFPSKQFAVFDAYNQAFSVLEEAQAAQAALTG